MDYTTLLVARSCMLIPVVALNVLILQKHYSCYRYILFLAATIGLILFSLPEYGINHLQNDARRITRHWFIGFMLLWANIFIDASTYIILEHIVSHPAQYGQLKGASRMLIQSGISMLLTFGYLILAPYLPTSTGAPQEIIMELSNVAKFVRNSPEVLYDVVGFALCGSLAQVLLFTAFREFSSLLQVQIRIARKTLSTVFSITWFKRTLTFNQFFGVVLVFGAISLEGLVQKKEQKEKKKRA
jgi:UDP-galactose transporter B1